MVPFFAVLPMLLSILRSDLEIMRLGEREKGDKYLLSDMTHPLETGGWPIKLARMITQAGSVVVTVSITR